MGGSVLPMKSTSIPAPALPSYEGLRVLALGEYQYGGFLQLGES